MNCDCLSLQSAHDSLHIISVDRPDFMIDVASGGCCDHIYTQVMVLTCMKPPPSLNAGFPLSRKNSYFD